MSPRVQNIIDKVTDLVLIGIGLNMIFRVQRNRALNIYEDGVTSARP
ncbi:hypothetical protein KAI36_03505 [Paenibacillus sp. S02]|nr:hypothetical protein KAI36_03505 [Paenibacillus sp. S02]